MARPIENTPVLHGENAVRFLSAVRDPQPISDSKKQRMKEAYERMKMIASFDL